MRPSLEVCFGSLCCCRMTRTRLCCKMLWWTFWFRMPVTHSEPQTVNTIKLPPPCLTAGVTYSGTNLSPTRQCTKTLRAEPQTSSLKMSTGSAVYLASLFYCLKILLSYCHSICQTCSSDSSFHSWNWGLLTSNSVKLRSNVLSFEPTIKQAVDSPKLVFWFSWSIGSARPLPKFLLL